MAIVREFKLINDNGQEYSLMDIENFCLLTEPEGLGYSYNTEYECVGNTFIENIRKIQQGAINAEVNFISYDKYKEFVDFIENSMSLKIAYRIPFEKKEKEYLRVVQISSLGKTQKNTNGIITEPVTFNFLSLWYEEREEIYSIEPEEDEIRWDFEWDSRFNDYNSQSIDYKNQGHVEAPVLLEIEGPVENPIIEVYIDKKLYQRVTLTVEIDEYEKITYNSKENEFGIFKINTDGTKESLFDLDVLGNFPYEDPVIRLPKNQDCEIRLRADDAIQKAKLTILPQYFTV